MFGLAQPSAWEDRKQARNEGDTDRHPSRNIRCTSTSRTNATAAGSPPRSRPTASLLPTLLPACCHCLALPAMPHLTLQLPATPGPRPSAALYTGRRGIPRLARPAWPLSPALCVCVCWVCDAPVPVDAPLAFGLAAVCYAVASALFRPLLCLRSRFRFRMLMWVVARPAAFVCEVLCTLFPCWSWCCVGCNRVGSRLVGCLLSAALSVVPPLHTTSIHHTPHHAISTHLIHYTPRIPQ